MSRKNTSPIQGQESLFVGGSNGNEYSDPAFHTWQEVESNPLLKSPYLHGDITAPAVDIESRAYHLSKALIAMGKANQREGFGLAASIEPHASEIWGRYKRGTDKVVERATDNIVGFNEEAKRNFWQATGFTVLRASGLMNKAELDARAKGTWTDFSRRFAGPPHRERRDKFKRNLRKQMTAQKMIKKSLRS